MDMPASNKQLPSADRSFFGHPRGLSTLFFTEMWERFSYYGIRPLLVIFMSTAIMSGGFGIPRSQASAIVGIYAASVYLASLPGGWVADRILAYRERRRRTPFVFVPMSVADACLVLMNTFLAVASSPWIGISERTENMAVMLFP